MYDKKYEHLSKFINTQNQLEENTNVMCTDKPSGNKTHFMVGCKDFVHNYMLQRGVLFPSSGIGDAEQLLLLCS